MSSGKPVLILCFVFLFELCQACPSVCMCKWKNGKQTVECDKRGLLAIPKGIDPGTQVLNFSSNNLQSLAKEKFLRMDLINLQRIYLSRCRISTIEDRTFKGLTNLVELDLSGNLLVSVPSETFIDCPSLMKLTLNANPIKTIRRAAFNHLSYLNTLEIGDCEISYVEEGAFLGLTSLEWLRLDGNKLTTLRSLRILPKSLRGIELQGNAWECDCHLVELHLWLFEFNMPHNVEPVCSGPSRLSGQTVRSVADSDLACLPDVSPTTFYLEIGEGKNVSLLCHVRAIPEARVSWLFQGRVLQNDTIVAPGLHLIYFIEDGMEDKRSELFIYNTNVEDNGTFVCTAENSAGAMQSNFTLRVVIKQEPVSVVVVPFSFEYLLILISAAAVFAVITILLAVFYVIKCTAHRSKRKKSKIATLNNSTKDSLFQDSSEDYSEPLKENTNLIVVDRHHEMMVMHAAPHITDEMTISPVVTCNPPKSPTSLKRFQLEQNPDLINDTESVERQREGDIKDQTRGGYGKVTENTITDFELRPRLESGLSNREFYSLPADVHLNPIGLLGTEDTRVSFYRTLPHNRANRQSSARYSREVEFLSRSHPPSYEHYCPGVRYTADGYQICTAKPGSPSEYRASPSKSCCAPPPLVQWPHCVPASNLVNTGTCPYMTKEITKRCVGAQTESESSKSSSKPVNKSLHNVKIHEVLTESPDEGYEGESGESTSNPG
ncbi:hypothetical protein PPYR_07486 [Photinus pyralis]|uniref:Ig-like domain-containing protein n=1 Tax=Photinus pyralis TaxID=7054 RepID=A0A1Y1LJV1_PHOPY|nr:uncharacterized protein LOC116167840 [Photinus pyralis]XP_031339251.1 uncharacterized protein LOC116167840 [Photinus pyralis]XP_031339252.1 uncharacterized protein LOC116167840 [Photinus pyralis]XP_031341721.1 uncharacterized protein LOC116169710 [Photinus pyralis]KAB0799606.1 hypothetical protein PPYR_07486 [Photinus pyralis]